jgi:peroxiredoxin
LKNLVVSLAVLFLYSCGPKENSSATTTVPNSNTSGSSFQVPPAENPDISIKVEGYNGTGLVQLVGIFEGQNYLVDSTRIQNGSIQFKKNTPYQQGLLFAVFPDNQNIQLLVSHDQTFSMQFNMADPVSTMKVDGSLDNQLLYDAFRFEAKQRPIFQQVAAQMRGKSPSSPEYQQLKAQQDKVLDERNDYLNNIYKEHPNTLFTHFKRAGANPDIRDAFNADGSLNNELYAYRYRNEFWEGVDFSDERLLYTPVISNKLNRYINELTPQIPDSILKYSYKLIDQVNPQSEYFKYFTNWVVLNYEPTKTQLMDAEAIYVNMVQRYFTKDKAFWSDSMEIYGLQQRADEMAASLMGKKGPNVTAQNPEGKTISLYDIKDPYIVVYMYNPDCEHCEEETPKLVELYKTWKPKGMEVFGIAVDTEDKDWKDYIRKNNMKWPNVFDPTNRSIYKKYYVNLTPEIYVLNPERTIIAKNLKVHQIAEMIERDMAKR